MHCRCRSHGWPCTLSSFRSQALSTRCCCLGQGAGGRIRPGRAQRRAMESRRRGNHRATEGAHATRACHTKHARGGEPQSAPDGAQTPRQTHHRDTKAAANAAAGATACAAGSATAGARSIGHNSLRSLAFFSSNSSCLISSASRICLSSTRRAITSPRATWVASH